MPAQPDDPTATLREFKAAVNMSPAALEKWLATGESRAVGIAHGEGSESVGHHSGRRIVELLRKDDADLSDSDVAHMRKVVGYVHRHLAQRPDGDVRHTRWRWSLMNWGHDPLDD
ncbi:DUF3140 domain-containing protein [Scleromatobacter humisilvae]|uniref:DUF3140 domain-containing protein n=1 Tax=Scleromatobacter humisilvae TaxID=2897159 RepID=A0A9X2C0W0_9BURK|nr:DUF3140 domain-containing protein [Scleromatobacter humisilvae]MCK9686896.1 DUF3140 domain-containing protein [Scleromatobacter humisilvae]